jgi:hypothetical protein
VVCYGFRHPNLVLKNWMKGTISKTPGMVETVQKSLNQSFQFLTGAFIKNNISGWWSKMVFYGGVETTSQI